MGLNNAKPCCCSGHDEGIGVTMRPAGYNESINVSGLEDKYLISGDGRRADQSAPIDDPNMEPISEPVSVSIPPAAEAAPTPPGDVAGYDDFQQALPPPPPPQESPPPQEQEQEPAQEQPQKAAPQEQPQEPPEVTPEATPSTAPPPPKPLPEKAAGGLTEEVREGIYVVVLESATNGPFGFSLRQKEDTMVIASIATNGVLAEWNRKHPEMKVEMGTRVLELGTTDLRSVKNKGPKYIGQAIIGACKKSPLKIVLERAAPDSTVNAA